MSITITTFQGVRFPHGERVTFPDWPGFLQWLTPPAPPPFRGEADTPGWSPEALVRLADELEAA